MLKLLHWTAQTFGALVGGIWLMVLYVLTIWISVGSLSAIQVRTELQSADRAFSFDNVQRAQEKLNQQIAAINRRVDSLNTINRIYYDMEQKLRQVQFMIGAEEEQIDVWQYALRPEFIAVQTQCKIDPAATGAPELCDAVEAYDALAAEADRVERQGFDPVEKIRAEAREQIEKLEAEEPLFKYFQTYAFFRDWNYKTFLHVPHEVLVLLLTMAMGMLGSVVTMTWLFIRQDSGMTIRRFLILPFIGSMSAFVIYVFLSAGQLTLTAGDTSDSLNPFVLSFVGIISGLLSERAYNRIADVGSNFFKIDDGTPRWALNLKAAMEAAGVTTAEIARHLGITEEEAGRIVDEATTATLPQQRLIAACLRRNLRDIFTDVPPDGPAALAAAELVAVPDLAGLDAAAARAALREAGLEFGTRAEAPDAAAAPGAVVAQSLPAQSRAARGARVDVTVATPPDSGG
jgi:hypothetical protein